MNTIKQKKLIVLILLSSIFLLTACEVNYENMGKGVIKNTITSEYDLTSNGTEEEDIEFRTLTREGVQEYYETKEEAIKHNRLGNNERPVEYELGEEVFVLEDDSQEVIFSIWDLPSGEVEFGVTRFFTKEEDGKTLYSEPALAVSFDKEFLESDLLTEGEKLERVWGFVNSMTSYQEYVDGEWVNKGITENHKDFRWGISPYENSEGLRVNGQGPTETIEIDLGNEKMYFYYFENFVE